MTVQDTYPDRPDIGLEGQRADSGDYDCVAGTNKEASAGMRIGAFVAREGGSDPLGALNFAAITDRVFGFLEHSHAYHKDQGVLNDEVQPGFKLSVARGGRFLALCEDGCSPGDRLHIRAVATGLEVPGAARASQDGTDTISAAAWGEWQSVTAAGQLGVLSINMPGVDSVYGPGGFVGSFANAARPDASTYSAGSWLFNTTSGSPNYSDGTQWLAADGTPT